MSTRIRRSVVRSRRRGLRASLAAVATLALATAGLLVAPLSASASPYTTPQSSMLAAQQTSLGTNGSPDAVDPTTHMVYGATGTGISALWYQNATSAATLTQSGAAISEVAFDSTNNRLYAYDSTHGVLYRVAPATAGSTAAATAFAAQALTTVATGLSTTVHSMVVESGTGTVWLGTATGVVMLDPMGTTPVGSNASATIALASSSPVTGFAVDATRHVVFVSQAAVNKVTAIENYKTVSPPTLVAVPITGTSPTGLAFDSYSKLLYVADNGSGTIESLSTTSLSSFTASASITTTSLSGHPFSLGIDPVHEQLWVSYSDTTSFSTVDVYNGVNNLISAAWGSASSGQNLTVDASSGIAWAGNWVQYLRQEVTGGQNQNGWYYYIDTPNVKAAVLPDGTGGVAYSGKFWIGESFIFSLGAAPAGLSLFNNGVVSGVPTQAGQFSFNVLVRQSGYVTSVDNQSGAAGCSPVGAWLGSITQCLSASNTPYTSPSFLIHPVPPVFTTAGLGSSTIAQNTALSFNLGATWMDGSAYPSSWTQPSWAITSGSLPSGLSLNSATGEVTGTPTVLGAYSFTVTATNPAGSASQSVTGTVAAVGPTITTTSLPDGTIGSAYTTTDSNGNTIPVQIAASGSPVTAWSATNLPAGLTIDPNSGEITGTPTTAVTAQQVTITASNAAGSNSVTIPLTINGVAPNQINWGNPIGMTGYVGTPFTFSPYTSMANVFSSPQIGTAPLTYTIDTTSGSYQGTALDNQLPAGLSLDSSGDVVGTPTAAAATTVGASGTAGRYNVCYNVSNAFGTVADAACYVFTILPAPTGSETITLQAGTTYTQDWQPGTNAVFPVEATNGTASSGTWNAQYSGQPILPSWLNFDDLMTWNGYGGFWGVVPLSAAGTSFPLIASYTDSTTSNTVYTLLNIVVQGPPPVLASTTAVNATGNTVSASIANTGGAATSWAVTNGSLPGTVALSSSGVLSGTAPGGTYTFTVTATNSGGSSSTVVTLVVPSVPVVTTPIALNWRVGTASTYTVTPTAGATPFSYAFDSSTPAPSWLTIGSSSGVLSGTAPSAGTYTYHVDVSNTASNGTPTVAVVTITALVAPGWASGTSTIPTPTVGVPYSVSVGAPTGTGPFTYSIGTGSLPAGLSINPSTGLITGTPTSTTASTFTVVVTNALGVGSAASTSVSTTPQVLAPQLASSAVTQYVQTGGSLSLTPTVTGGSPVTSWTVASGSKPSWISLSSSTGAMSGTAPSTAATSVFTLAASNAGGYANATYTIVVQALPSVSSFAPPAPTVGVPYSYTVPVTGTGPFTYSLSGTLPAGLSFAGGVISGTPTSTTSSTVTLTVNNGLSTQNGTGAATSTATIAPVVVAPTVAATASVTLANLAGLNYTVTPTAGSPVTSWSTSGAPSWLSFSGGVATGTPTAGGVYTVTLTGTNTAGSASTVLTITVTGPAVVASQTAPSFTAGLSNSYQIAASGNPTPSTYTATNLPAWASLNTSSGLVTGTPPVGTASPVAFSVTVSNGVGAPSTVTLTIPVAVVAPTIASTTNLSAVAPGVTSTQTVSQTGGTPGTFSLGNAMSPAPSWVSINPNTGVVTFTNPPTSAIAASPWTFPVTVTNIAGAATSTITVSVSNVPQIPATLSYTVATGSAFSHDFSTDVTGGSTPITSAVANGSSLPSWLSQSTSVFGGTVPSSPSIFSFTLSLTNANGTTTTAVTITSVTAPSWSSTPTPPQATQGVPYSYTIPTPSGTGPFTYGVSSGSLPAGLTLVGNVISGVPTGNGASNLTLTATNALGSASAASASTSITTVVVAPVMAATLTQTATTTSPYNHTFAPTGGSPVTAWTLGSGAPAGLTLSSGGVLSGTPTAAGASTFTVTASNTGGNGVTTVTLTVTAPPVVPATATAPVAPTGSAYSYTVPVAGAGSYSYALATGSTLPSWATLNPNGTITGTPTTAGGPTTFTVNVTNTAGTSSVTITLSSAVPPSAPSSINVVGYVGVPLSSSAAASSGSGTLTYSVTSGALPSGLALNTSSGLISGSPTATASGSAVVTVTGTAGSATTTVNYTVTVAAPTMTASATLYATETQPFSSTFTPTGGSPVGSYAVSWTGGAPTGLSIGSGSGVLSGTPATGSAGTYSASVTAHNGGGSAVTSLSLVILTMPSFSGPLSLASATSGQAYSRSAAASTGSGTLTYAVTTGTLPAGLALNPQTGLVTGTPTGLTASTATFTVTVTNQAGTTASTQVSIPLVVNPSLPATITAPAATVGQPYSYTVSAGGTGPITYTIGHGALPAGLSLNTATGQISGTPTGSGSVSCTIVATSSTGSASTTVTISVAAAATTTVSSSASGSSSSSTSSSGTASLSSAGTSSSAASSSSAGTSSQPGTTAAKAAAPVTTSTVPAMTARVGQLVSMKLPGFVGQPATFTVGANSLPPGLTLNPKTGAITGTATKAGVYRVTVEVKGADGREKIEHLTLTLDSSQQGTNDALTWAVGLSALLAVVLALLFWLLLARRRRRRESLEGNYA